MLLILGCCTYLTDEDTKETQTILMLLLLKFALGKVFTIGLDLA